MKKKLSTAAASRITLLLPGWADESSLLPHPTPLTEPVEVAVARALGIHFGSFADIPGAACRWQGSEPDLHPPANIVCADPVHLVAGSDDAQLIPTHRLNLTKEESKGFIDELNRALGENQSTFLHDSAMQWYYSGISTHALNTSSPVALAGHPMTLAMPREDALRPWRAFLSEVQMVLHQSPVNEARRSRGELPVNSVWFWGGGAMPEKIAADDKILYTDDGYSQGLAKAVGVECLPLSAAPEESLSDTHHAHHIILDTSLLADDSTLDSRHALGERWQASVHQCQGRMADIAAELEGLTGCRLNLSPTAVSSRSPLARLKNVFRR